MLEELKEIEYSLDVLSKELDQQLSATILEADKFHEQLINLLSKSPENKELIQFIVFINDRLVTNHTISRDILYDTIKGIIKQKQYLIKRLIKEYDVKPQSESTFSKVIEFFKANKTTLIVIGASVSITLLIVALFIIPTETMETIKLLKGFTK